MPKKKRKTRLSGSSDFLLLFIVNVIDQSFRGDDLLHKLRKRLALELCASGAVVDHTAVKVHLHLVTRLYAFAGLRALDGTVFRYGDNVDTDVIIPARYLNSSDPAELATHCR